MLKDNSDTTINKVSFFWLPIYYILLIITGYLSAEEVLLLYAIETLVIGFFNVIKIVGASSSKNQITSGITLATFFVFHYSVFCFVQLYFFFDILDYPSLKTHFFFFEKIQFFITHEHVSNSILGMILIYAYKTFRFFQNNEHIKIEAGVLMFQPYIRIFIQQFVALFPFFIFGFLQQKMVAAILLILLRSIVDYILLLIQISPEKLIVFLIKNNKEIKDSPEKIDEVKKFIKMMSK